MDGLRTWSSGLVWLLLGATVGVAGAGFVMLGDPPPWLETLAPTRAAWIVFLGSTLVGLAVCFVMRRRSIATAGRVIFDDRELAFLRGLWSTSVPYSDLDGFRDGHAEFVELVRGPGVGASFFFPRLTIPTKDEAVRVAVLSALDARGIRRLER